MHTAFRIFSHQINLLCGEIAQGHCYFHAVISVTIVSDFQAFGREAVMLDELHGLKVGQKNDFFLL